MSRMGDLDIMAREAGLTAQGRRTLPLADVVAAVARDTAPLESFPTDLEAFGRHLRGVIRVYVGSLQAAGIAEPLGARLTVAAVFADLFALVSEPEPPALARYVG